MDEKRSARLATTLLNDYVASRDTKELQLAIQQELIGGGENLTVALTTWFTDSFEKDIPRDVSAVSFLPFLRQHFIEGIFQRGEGGCSEAQFR
jgi:hypothetical protein